MDLLLRFRSRNLTNSYYEELRQEKNYNKYLILSVFLVSLVYSIADICKTAITLNDDNVGIKQEEMVPIYIFQGLKILIFIPYYGLKIKNRKRHIILDFMFGAIFMASMLTIWNIQLREDESRGHIIGLEATWTLLYIDTIVGAWGLKLVILNSIIVFGYLRSWFVRQRFSFDLIATLLQIGFIIALIYFREKRKRANFMKSNLLQGREKALTSIIDNIPENIAILNLKGEMVRCNQHFDTYFNMSDQNVSSDIFLKFFDIKARERNFEHMSSMIKSKVQPRQSKQVLVKIFPKTLDKVQSNPSISSLSAKPSKLMSAKEAVKSQVRAEKSKITRNTNSGILAGSSSASLTDLIIADQYHTLRDVITFFCAKTDILKKYLNKQTNFFIFDGKYKDIDDKIRSFEVKISIGIFDSDESLILILRDTTHRDIIVTLESNNNFKDSLLSSISHELKTPLNTNLNLLGMSIHDPKISTEIKDSYLLPAHQSGKLLQSLINDVLDYSLLLAKKFKVDIKGKYLLRSLDKLRYLTEFQAKKKGIAFHISVSQRLVYKIWTDHRRLRQILTNLLNNAIKFTNKGFIKMRVEPYEDNNQFIKFIVSDSGIGIDPEDVDRMTEILRDGSLDKKLTSKSTEVGMGLLISNLLAKYLGPHESNISGIHISSKAGEGSNFWFLIENREANLTLNSPAIVISSFQKSSSDSASFKVHENESTKSRHILFPQFQDETKTLSLMKIPSAKKRTLLELPGSSNLSENVDHTVLAEEDEVEEKLACMIKDDNVKVNLNAVKIFKDEVSFHRGYSGISKQFSTSYSRYPTGMGNITPQKALNRFYSPQLSAFSEIPQIMVNMNPVTHSELPFEDESTCACPELLVVDDDVFNLFTMENMLKSLGLPIIQAKNGEEAINAVKKRANFKCSDACKHFRLIFMDISMPKMDGYEATLKLKEMMASNSIPHIPIVAWTAFVDQDKIQRCVEVGMEGHIPKPVPINKLIEILKKFHIPLTVLNGSSPAV